MNKTDEISIIRKTLRRLEAEAKRQGVTPMELANRYVSEGISKFKNRRVE